MTDKKKDRPFVFVRCMTFNHEAYIKDALNGFVIQQTKFPFVVAIINDASTDKTKSVINEFVENNCIHNPEIDLRIEEYGTVLDVTVKDNPHCIFHIVHLNENHYGKKSKLPYFAKYENAAKYVAMCEGDDYWTDPLKLQKQVDFMEANPECGLVFTNHECDKNGVVFNVKSLIDNITFENLVLANTIVTCSVLYRRDMYITLVSDLLAIIRVNKLLMGDYPLWLLFAEKSQIKKIDCVSARYRLLEESASHSKNKRKSYRFDKSTLLCKKIFYERLRKRNDIRSIYQVIFYEMEFHARKRMLFDYGYIAFDQIFYLLKLLPLYPIIIYRSIRRKLVRENREYRENIF